MITFIGIKNVPIASMNLVLTHTHGAGSMMQSGNNIHCHPYNKYIVCDFLNSCLGKKSQSKWNWVQGNWPFKKTSARTFVRHVCLIIYWTWWLSYRAISLKYFYVFSSLSQQICDNMGIDPCFIIYDSLTYKWGIMSFVVEHLSLYHSPLSNYIVISFTVFVRLIY